ncbi:efflux RND transporter periplasmic adaptor subunit [Tahibacter sp.]|uniref:efflux RND transporter periplasmic adaptor subunit n=1 Tax=Tahibacter sp. TaxID=2056211 RepID=UPI0028C4D627|nr:efflux RND transporter periplasmic adaptor subunit [Tahibacter sp.]
MTAPAPSNPKHLSRVATRLSLVALALVAAIGVGLSGCSSTAAPAAPPPPDVSVAAVVAKPVRQWDDFTGRIGAVEMVELRARVSGYVQRVAYEEGQEVKKGDLLFVIDPRPYRAVLDRALADLDRARAEARLAQAQDARAQSLIEAKAISREEFETRKAATAQGGAGVRAAEAAVAAAQLDLTFTEVRSPIDGRAGRAAITQGNLAQADATLLTTVVSQDPVYVNFESDEQAYLRYLELARKGERSGSHNPVRVGLANEDGYPHEGTVDFVDNQVDAATGTIRARAILRNPDRVFTPGLFARVQLEGSAEFQALLIDDKAVLTDQDRKYVYVLGEQNKAMRKDVVLGRTVEGLRVVQSGLQAQEKVIVHGVQKVFFPGMPVTPTLIEMGAAAPPPQQVAVH